MKLVRKLVAPTIWVIVLSFVLWGGSSVLTGFRKETQGVGTAFGDIVTFKEFQSAARSVELFLKKPQDEKWNVEELEQTAWQNIVLARAAEREGMRVTDDEVRQEIKRLFGTQGDIDQNVYQNWIARNFGEQPRAFEESVRKILMIRKLVDAKKGREKRVTHKEVRRMFFNEQNKVSVDYARFKTLEEANQFEAQAKKEKAFWDNEKKKEGSKMSSMGFVSLDILIKILSLSQTDVDNLFALQKGEISKPFPVNKEFAVFRLTDKQVTPEEKFDDSKKEEYRKRLIEEKQQRTFMKWWDELLKRAAVEKFTPPGQPSSPQEGEEAPEPVKIKTSAPLAKTPAVPAQKS